MNINTLNYHLTKLSPNEEKYLSGEKKPDWSQHPHKIINGREVKIINFPSTLEHLLPSQINFFSGAQHSAASRNAYISVKQNSRFAPVPEHIHSYIELNYVYSGSCSQIIDQKEIVLNKNQILLIDTECPHSIKYLNHDDIMISLMISHSFLRNHLFQQFSQDSILSKFFINAINAKTNHDHFLLFHSENNRRIPIFFQELLCECFDPSINSEDILLHLFALIMAELINVYKNDMTRETSFEGSASVVPMIRFIERNYNTCTQKSVAEFFHITPNYVSTLLKKNIGMTYIQMIQTLRLQQAANLLKNTEQAVADIANQVGYENVSFFYKKFQDKYGCLPKEYREKFRQNI